jgi:hypothetical protein
MAASAFFASDKNLGLGFMVIDGTVLRQDDGRIEYP